AQSRHPQSSRFCGGIEHGADAVTMPPKENAMKGPPPIGQDERLTRLERLRALADEAGFAAVLLGPTASFRYSPAAACHPSERFAGAIVHTSGGLEYVCPGVERSKVASIVGVPGDILTWEEDENPYRLIASRLKPNTRFALDDAVQHFFYL